MVKFLDKKEQVIDFQLTPYGKYLMSVGVFKPAYYSFYDSNILYDKQYARGTYCKSASCGTREVTEVVFVSGDLSPYSSVTSPGYLNYFTLYNGSEPYNFWFKTSADDYEPGSGIIGAKPMIDLTSIGGSPSKEKIAKKVWSTINAEPVPFTANYAAGGAVVFVTASALGESIDVSQTLTANVLTASVHVQGAPFEVYRAYSDVPVENQNEIEKRIKKETQYLEGILSFDDLETAPRKRREKLFLAPATPFIYDLTSIREVPEKDIFKFDSAIGDARFDNEKKQYAPAWKIVTLAGQISSSVTKDIPNEQLIPQINIDMMYSKEIKDVIFEFRDSEVVETIDTVSEVSRTRKFIDDKTVALVNEDLLIYTEELNSEFLMENFDIEVYQVVPAKYDAFGKVMPNTEKLVRKFFNRKTPQIVDGLMTRSTPAQEITERNKSLTTSSVEYYFDIFTDNSVNEKVACQGANIFNKDSYYIDIDFECEQEESESAYFDIYGRATDPEICLT